MERNDQKITPFLMFSGRAEEAMNLYTSLFDDSEIIEIQRHEPSADSAKGSVYHATFTLNGQTFRCIDSAVEHDFTFTPAMSLYVGCRTESEIDRLYERLSQGGAVLMPIDAYPFSKKYAWLTDRFGVSWQLNLNE